VLSGWAQPPFFRPFLPSLSPTHVLVFPHPHPTARRTGFPASLPTAAPLGKPKGPAGNRIASMVVARVPKVKPGAAVDMVERDDFGDPVSEPFVWDGEAEGGILGEGAGAGSSLHGSEDLERYGAADEALAAALAAADAVPEDPTIIKYGIGGRLPTAQPCHARTTRKMNSPHDANTHHPTFEIWAARCLFQATGAHPCVHLGTLAAFIGSS
jgi:hypothetical protein